LLAQERDITGTWQGTLQTDKEPANRQPIPVNVRPLDLVEKPSEN
jgi:hypothetical protein